MKNIIWIWKDSNIQEHPIYYISIGGNHAMKKNDKLVVIVGVIILIVSSIGIFTFQQEPSGAQAAKIDEVFEISGTLTDMPDSIIASDTSPFYPLIATPIAVNYDSLGEQSVIPLYVMNHTKTICKNLLSDVLE